MSAITYAPTVASASAGVTRLRLTRRGRAVIALLVSLPLAVALVSMAVNGGVATANSGSVVVATVTVEVGESLWSVAAALAPDASTADVVADLIAVNNLTSAELLPGQVLNVPERYVD